MSNQQMRSGSPSWLTSSLLALHETRLCSRPVCPNVSCAVSISAGALSEYLTAAGPVQVERSLYKDRSDEGERAIVPMELQLGIMAGYFTPRAAKQGLWLVSQMTPTTAAECCERMGNMMPSKSTLDRLPKRAKETWEEDEGRYNAALRDAMVIPEQARSVAVSLDGVLIPMKDAKGPETRQKAADSGKLSALRGPLTYMGGAIIVLLFLNLIAVLVRKRGAAPATAPLPAPRAEDRPHAATK